MALLHPDLGRYDATDVATELRQRGVDSTTAQAEQIYTFPFLTSVYCKKLVDEVDQQHQWMNETSLDTHGPLRWVENQDQCAHLLNRPLHPRPFRVDVPYEPDHCFPLCLLPGVNRAYEQLVDEHIAPLMKSLWPDFVMRIVDQPYVLKYEAGLATAMEVHDDEETFALIAYLNDEYTGGGTYFPQHNYETGKMPVGSAVIYPGGRSHLHGGRPITSGKRYILLLAFF